MGQCPDSRSPQPPPGLIDSLWSVTGTLDSGIHMYFRRPSSASPPAVSYSRGAFRQSPNTRRWPPAASGKD
ncbi:hypothetical protein E2C01_065977 [Portunus trituberculatus]|uniref:Uncharacterized protein n=1 Tax=Portunus trituberculatus TaxID=210409 RepID=A0A5B7HKA2_PORTR|nr:hypothetical protein [Portunus trituberculatus]